MTESLSIFLPFYNDAGTVQLMIDEAYYYGLKLTTELEVIAINDGSVDDTQNELDRVKLHYPDLKVIRHAHNKGYGGALISGFNNATKKWVFYTDGDAQYRLNEMHLLWNLKYGSDVVNGYKMSRSDNWLRKMVGASYSRLIKAIFKIPISDIDCDYRLIRGDLLHAVDLHCVSGAITVELIKKLYLKTDKFKEVGINHYKRIYGHSTFFTLSNIVDTFKDEYSLLKEVRNMRPTK